MRSIFLNHVTGCAVRRAAVCAAQRVSACIFAFCVFLAPARAAVSDGLDPANLDRSISPARDFYGFAVGGWLAKNVIPPDRTSWGAFDELQHRNERRIAELLLGSDVTDAPVGSERRKLGDFYAACTDTDEIDRGGIAALAPALRATSALRSTREIAPLLAASQQFGSTAAFEFGPEQDPANAKSMIAALGQGGLSLPTPDYYTSQAPRSKAIRAALERYMRRAFVLLGDSAAASELETLAVMRLESRLAKASRPPEDLRDPFANYHPLAIRGVRALAPEFDWAGYFAVSGVSASGSALVDVGQPEFFRALETQLRSTPLADWKSYLRWHDVLAVGAALPQSFRDAAFAFEHVESGIAAPPARTRVCGELTDEALGFALGKVYVRRYFPPAARARARAEVGLIKAALRNDIEHVAWMSPPTRAAALAKLAKLNTRKIGFPDRWRDYSALTVERDDFLGDELRARRFEALRENAKIGRPVDRSEWGLTPQTVNAYYDPSMNEIVVPAGILEPPFFDPSADDAINFGGIGAVIGHEMTHGFDDEGSDFDGDGNLHPVVTKADAARFHARVECIVDQASAYPALGTLHLNGKLDAGEATADLGGTTLAFRALEGALRSGVRPPLIDGFSPEQRFYLSWAEVWREKDRPEAEREQILGDPHPIARYRVNGTLSDEVTFYRAFDVAPGSPMWKPEGKRCRIW
jgi:predicted metalloendopeptidase